MSDMLDSYGALQQVVTESTRKDEILDVIITDLHTLYHAPICVPPLQVDEGRVGKDSDHNVVIFPPIPSFNKSTKRDYKIIKTRPISVSQISKIGNVIGRYPWNEVLSVTNTETNVSNFIKL